MCSFFVHSSVINTARELLLIFVNLSFSLLSPLSQHVVQEEETAQKVSADLFILPFLSFIETVVGSKLIIKIKKREYKL